MGTAYLLRFPRLADFHVSRDASDITCFPVPGVSEATLEHLYLNQVLPLARSKQGDLVFHASAVDFGGYAVAFLGNSGRGKSTLAASLAVAGHRLLTDDGLELRRGAEGAFIAVPSHPSLRLWEDSERAVMPGGVERALPVQYTPKARLLAGGQLPFCAEPLPLRCACFLGDGSAGDVVIERLTGAEAHFEWVKHSFILDAEEKPLLSAHFERVADLASRPIHFRLDYPRRFDMLGEVRQGLLKHARALAA